MAKNDTSYSMHADAVDRETEALLSELGVDYQKTNILLSAIDARSTLGTQAREEALDEDTCLRYADALEHGDRFPRIIVADLGKNKVTALAGRHRVAGADLVNIKELPAFLVRSLTPAQATRIVIETNLRNGKQLTRLDVLRHGSVLVRTYGMTQREAARHVRVHPQSLSDYLRKMEASERLAGLGLSQVTNGTALRRLGSIPSDRVLIVVYKRLMPLCSSNQLSTHITEVNRQRSEDEALALVDALVAEYEQQAQSAGGMTPPNTRGKTMRAVVAVDRAVGRLPSVEMLTSMSKREQAQARKLLARCAQRLDAALEVLPL